MKIEDVRLKTTPLLADTGAEHGKAGAFIRCPLLELPGNGSGQSTGRERLLELSGCSQAAGSSCHGWIIDVYLSVKYK